VIARGQEGNHFFRRAKFEVPVKFVYMIHDHDSYTILSIGENNKVKDCGKHTWPGDKGFLIAGYFVPFPGS